MSNQLLTINYKRTNIIQQSLELILTNEINYLKHAYPNDLDAEQTIAFFQGILDNNSHIPMTRLLRDYLEDVIENEIDYLNNFFLKDGLPNKYQEKETLQLLKFYKYLVNLIEIKSFNQTETALPA